jgi:hypothetical protein
MAAEPIPVPAAKRRRLAPRTVAAPVLDFFNSHFEMVKEEQRRMDERTIALLEEIVRKLDLIAENSTETALHQAWALSSVRDSVEALIESRLGEAPTDSNR